MFSIPKWNARPESGRAKPQFAIQTFGTSGRRLLGLCFVALAPLVLMACEESTTAESSVPATPPSVTVSQPVLREITEWDEYTGRFQAVENVEIRSRISGYLESIHFTDGQTVQEGDLLFVIDQRPFEVALERAEAELNQARTRVSLADKELERARPLLSRGNIAQSVFDERLQAKQEADAAVRGAIAAVNAAKLDLAYTEIKAPVTGRISQHEVSVGNLVTGGTANATLLTVIVSIDPIHFYFDANEAAFLKYARLARSGQRASSREAANPVQLSLFDEDGFPHRGEMNFVENRFDTETGTVRGRAVFENSDSIFVPGMFARIRLLGSGSYQAVMVPDEVIGTDQSRKFVYVVDDQGTVAARLVELGPVIDGLRVVREGLAAEDRIIIAGIQRARAGAKVTAEPGQIQAGSGSTTQ